MATSVAIVDDNAEICEDLAEFLEETEDFVCVCTCQSGRTALRKIPECVPDIVIMGTQLPDISGIKCTAKLKQLMPNTQILMFTVCKDDDHIFQALEAGASGYILKGGGLSDIESALRDLVAGGSPMTSAVSRKVVESFYLPAPEPGTATSLTLREREVLDLLAEGHSSKAIADQLFINIQTVNYHLKQIYQKMHVGSRAEAIIRYQHLRRRWSA